MKKVVIGCLLLICSVGLQVSAMEDAEAFTMKKSALMVPQSLGDIDVFHNKDGFHVTHEDTTYKVKNYFVDPLLRRANKKTLKKFQKVGYLSVKQMSDGEFSLTAKTRGLGGGALGATIGFWAGKVIVYGVSYGVLGLVTLPIGSFGNPVTLGIAAALAAPIEAASNVGAIGTAIVVGTATGPV